jgi:hypothetical protein
MARFQYIVMTRSIPGEIDAFDTWYDEQHLHDARAFPGIVACKRFKILHSLGASDQGLPVIDSPFDSIAIYEMETDDPDDLARRLVAQAGTDAMPLSDAYDRSATVKYVTVAAGELT